MASSKKSNGNFTRGKSGSGRDKGSFAQGKGGLAQGKGGLALLVVLYAGAFVGGFNENLANMALVPIMGDYGISSVTAQWLVTGYMIVATVIVMTMAFLYRRIPLRILFYAAVAFTFIGSVLGLFASSFALLLIARLVQAIGSGIFIPLMINTVLRVAPRNRIGTFMSIGSCMITFGPALAPVATGGLVSARGWHSVFAIPIAAMVVLAALGIPFVRNLETQDVRLDAPSVGLSAVFLFTLSFGLAQLLTDPLQAGIALAVCAASAVAFILRQLRVESPLIDLSPMRQGTFWPTIMLVTIAMMSTFSLSVLLPVYLEGALGMEAFVAGLVILVPVLANAGTTLIGGRIMDRAGEWPLLPLGFAVVAVGFCLMAATAVELSAGLLFASALVAYVGVGLVFSPSQTSGLRTLPPQMNPHGVALNTTFIQIAACVGPALYTGIMQGVQAGAMDSSASAEIALAEGFRIAMMVAAVIGVAGFAIALKHALAMRRRTAASEKARQAAPAAGTLLASIMDSDSYALPPEASMVDAMRALAQRHVSGMPLVDREGHVLGFISDGDIMRYLADSHPAVVGTYSLMELANGETVDERLHDLVNRSVAEVATRQVVCLPVGASLEDACDVLAAHKLKKVPVVEDGRIVGMLSRSNVIRYIMENLIAAEAGA